MRIVYFDGVCNLCNGFVDFLMRHDRNRILRLASLQGSTARERLPLPYREGLETVVFEEEGRLYVRSAAAVRAVAALGGSYRLSLGFLAVPRPIRDWVYAFVARRRYVWFGKRDTCRLPSEQEKIHFLP